MKQTPLLLLAAIFLFVSCKGTKNIGDSDAVNMATGAIINSHNAAYPNFETLAARIQVVYSDGEGSQSATVSLRMEKNKNIWIKASLLGITLAKVLITPDRVSYYETIDGTYFEGDFSLLSEWLSTDIDFEKAQAILLGQSIFNLNSAVYTSQTVANNIKLQPKVQPQNFIHSLLLNPQNFKVISESISQPNESRLLSVRYDDYQNVAGSFYPSEIEIMAKENNETTQIGVIYKKIDVNVSVGFPFEIPSGYQEIRLD